MDTFMSADALLAHWQGHRRLTRRVIDAFPEDQLFTFAVGGMRPFGSMAMEMLAMGPPMLRGVLSGERTTVFGQYTDALHNLILYVVDNEIHHRGQGYVYLRALGIEPPPFYERE